MALVPFGCALLAVTAAGFAEVTVSGRVVDAAGEPIVDARVATTWSFEDGRPVAWKPANVDASGRFSGTFRVYDDPFALVAYSEDGGLAGYAIVQGDDAGAVEIRALPTVRVRAHVTCDELGRSPEAVSWSWEYGDQTLVSFIAQSALDVRLPRGDAAWTVYDAYFTERRGELSLTGDAAEVELGAIDLPAHFLAKHQGKVLPDWTVGEARGVQLEHAQLSDFRGKWLLVEFWGYW